MDDKINSTVPNKPENKLLGQPFPLRIGDRVSDLQPIRVIDWPRFARVSWVFDIPRLQEIYAYKDAYESLDEALKVITRQEAVPECYADMTQKHYAELRNIVTQQNDLDFEFLHQKMDKEAKKD